MLRNSLINLVFYWWTLIIWFTDLPNAKEVGAVWGPSCSESHYFKGRKIVLRIYLFLINSDHNAMYLFKKSSSKESKTIN